VGPARRGGPTWREFLSAQAEDPGYRRSNGGLERCGRREPRWRITPPRAAAALVLSREIGDPSTEAHAHNLLGALHRLAGEIDKAIEQHRQAHTIARRTGNRFREATALIGLAQAAVDSGVLASARSSRRPGST
jgi:hypothetical protein